jgi:hypothetical protein
MHSSGTLQKGQETEIVRFVFWIFNWHCDIIRIKQKGRVRIVPLLNELSIKPSGCKGERGYSSAVLDLDTKQRWWVSFEPWPLYPSRVYSDVCMYIFFLRNPTLKVFCLLSSPFEVQVKETALKLSLKNWL